MVYDILPERDLHYSDIRDTLNANGGSVNNDVSTAFKTSANINKWSKKKPIRYPKDGTLTDAEFKGTFADNNNGIYYGLKASTKGDFSDIHDATYDYVGLPVGGQNEPFRLGDFRGYDTKALPTLVCLGFPDEWYYNMEISTVIEYDYNHSNITGVDIDDFLPDNVAEDIGNYYPCILVGTWAKVMYNKMLSDTTQNKNVYTSLRHDGAWYSNFYADLQSNPDQTAGTKKVSVFLVRKVIQPGLMDFTKWTNVSSIIQPFEGISVPEGTGKDIIFTKYTSYAEFNAFIFNPNKSGFAINMQFVDKEPDKEVTYTCSINSPGVGAKSFTFTPDSGLIQIWSFTFNWKDIGYIPIPGTKKEITISGSVRGSDGSFSSFDGTYEIQF